jgi:exosortase A-associated hydrolase 2
MKFPNIENYQGAIMELDAGQAFYFENKGSSVFAFLHNPNADAQQIRDTAVLFCHPFAEEKAVSHRILFDFATTLCQQGFPVLRFDYRCCGDSEGEFNELTLSGQLSDIRRATDIVFEHTGANHLCLFGLRLGGTFAALAAEDEPRVQALILWEPILRGRDYLDQFLRLQVVADNKEQGSIGTRKGLIDKMKQDGYVDILGYEISAHFFEELSKVDLLSSIGHFRGAIQVAAINKRGRARDELQALVAKYIAHGAHGQSAAVADTPFWNDPNNPWRELAFWHNHDSLFQQSIEWLKATCDDTSFARRR